MGGSASAMGGARSVSDPWARISGRSHRSGRGVPQRATLRPESAGVLADLAKGSLAIRPLGPIRLRSPSSSWLKASDGELAEGLLAVRPLGPTRRVPSPSWPRASDDELVEGLLAFSVLCWICNFVCCAWSNSNMEIAIFDL